MESWTGCRPGVEGNGVKRSPPCLIDGSLDVLMQFAIDARHNLRGVSIGVKLIGYVKVVQCGLKHEGRWILEDMTGSERSLYQVPVRGLPARVIAYGDAMSALLRRWNCIYPQTRHSIRVMRINTSKIITVLLACLMRLFTFSGDCRKTMIGLHLHSPVHPINSPFVVYHHFNNTLHSRSFP